MGSKLTDVVLTPEPQTPEPRSPEPLFSEPLTPDPLVSHPHFPHLSDVELAVVVTKELSHVVSMWESGQSSGNLPGLGAQSLKDRVKNMTSLPVHTKCDVWSLLHMANHLIFSSSTHHFRDCGEREVFITLCGDVFSAVRGHVVQGHVTGGTQLSGTHHSVYDEDLQLPEPKTRDRATARDQGPIIQGVVDTDYTSLGDLETVVMSCKELDAIITKRFLKPKHKGLVDFGEKVSYAINIDEDVRQKLDWVEGQRDVFLTDRSVNSFPNEQSRTFYFDVCTEIKKKLSKNHSKNSTNISNNITNNFTNISNNITNIPRVQPTESSELCGRNVNDERSLIPIFVNYSSGGLNRLTSIFILFGLIMFVIVLSVLLYIFTKPK